MEFENSLGPWLGKTVKIIDYLLYESLRSIDVNLSKEQMIVLKKLTDCDGLNQNELAFLTIRNKSSLARLLAKMEQKKFIIRKLSSEDKRVKRVYITQLGKDVYSKVKPVLKKLIDKIEDGITESEKEQMITTLKKIQKTLDSKPESI